MPVWEIPIGEDDSMYYAFYRCPVLFLTSEVRSWYEEYNLIKNGLVTPDKYNEKQARWFEAVKIYESYYNMFLKQKTKGK